RGIAKIKIRRAFPIDLTHAQVANAATAQCQSFVHLRHQHDLRRAPIKGHRSGGKSAKDVNNNGGARSFLGPLQEAAETDFHAGSLVSNGTSVKSMPQGSATRRDILVRPRMLSKLGKSLWKKCVLLTPNCGYPQRKNANVV